MVILQVVLERSIPAMSNSVEIGEWLKAGNLISSRTVESQKNNLGSELLDTLRHEGKNLLSILFKAARGIEVIAPERPASAGEMLKLVQLVSGWRHLSTIFESEALRLTSRATPPCRCELETSGGGRSK
jgi:hypothetical protein